MFTRTFVIVSGIFSNSISCTSKGISPLNILASPAEQSRVILSPSSRSRTPTTPTAHGIPLSLETIAACEVRLPLSQIIAETLSRLIITSQSGVVMDVTSIGFMPFSLYSAISLLASSGPIALTTAPEAIFVPTGIPT